VRELRDLTRRRKQILSNAGSERNRVQKVLEEANVKIGSVLTDVFGVSGQLMLEALLEGKATVEQIADLARHTARRKIPEIIKSLEGNRLDGHYRMLIRLRFHGELAELAGQSAFEALSGSSDFCPTGKDGRNWHHVAICWACPRCRDRFQSANRRALNPNQSSVRHAAVVA
jgi:hypothetical protein